MKKIEINTGFLIGRDLTQDLPWRKCKKKEFHRILQTIEEENFDPVLAQNEEREVSKTDRKFDENRHRKKFSKNLKASLKRKRKMLLTQTWVECKVRKILKVRFF